MCRLKILEVFLKIFLEVTNNAFLLYINYLQVSFRVYLNSLMSITEIIDQCYVVEKSGIMLVKKVKRFGYKSLLKMYIACGRNLLRYLNIFLSNSAFERIFLTYKPGKDYIDKNFRILNNLNIQEKIRGRDLDSMLAFLFPEKRDVHFAFKFVISDQDCFDKLIGFVSDEWERRKTFFSGYEMVYPRLSSSMKWRYDYVLFFVCFFLRKGKKIR